MDEILLLLAKGSMLAASVWVILIKLPHQTRWWAKERLWIVDAAAMTGFVWATTVARSTEIMLSAGCAGLIFTALIHATAPVLRKIRD